MADNTELYFREVIERLRREGELLRNQGAHSIKTVKELMAKVSSDAIDQRSKIAKSASSVRSGGVGDDVEEKRDNKDFRYAQIDILEDIADILHEQLTLTKQGGSAAGKGKGKQGKFGGLLAGAGAGVGAGIGLAGAGIGLGIGAASAGISLIIKEVSVLMKSFDDLAVGLDDLNKLDIDPAKFEILGGAIHSLASGVGIGGAIGLRILSGAAFNDLGAGIETLNNLKYDPAGIENLGKTLAALKENTGVISSFGLGMLADTDFVKIADGLTALNNVELDTDKLTMVGEGLNALIEPLSAGDIGEAQVLGQVSDGLTSSFTDAVSNLNDLKVGEDFQDKLGYIGNGLDNLLSPLSILDLGETGILQILSGQLPYVRDGVNAFNEVDGNSFAIKSRNVGKGFKDLLEGVSSFSGMVGLQAIDDNIKPVADGINYFNRLVTSDGANQWLHTTGIVGAGFEKILDGTDDLLGAVGMQAIDDNIKPVADAISYWTELVDDKTAKSFVATGKLVGTGFQNILDGTDDLLGVTGFQSLEDNLIPFANGVSLLNTVGEDLELNNFLKIRDAIKEMRNIIKDLGSLDIDVMNDASFDIDDIADRALDMQKLIMGLGQGGDLDGFKTIGTLGIGNSIDFGEGILNADLQVDGLLTKVQKMQDAIKGLTSIDASGVGQVSSSKQSSSEEMQKQTLENQQMSSSGGVNVVDASTKTQSTVNNNNSTAAIVGPPEPTDKSDSMRIVNWGELYGF